MNRIIVYQLFSLLYSASSLCMDVDIDRWLAESPSPDEQELRNPSSPENYCLFIKLQHDTIGIPVGLKEFFREKIEIADTLNHDTMTLFMPYLEKESVDTILNFLRAYQLAHTWDGVNHHLQNAPLDELAKLAKTATSLNQYPLKPLIRGAILNTVKMVNQAPQVQQIQTLKKIDSLEEYYVKPIKNTLFDTFKRSLRDKNPLFGAPKKVITQIPHQDIKDICFSGYGNVVLWVTGDHHFKGYDLSNNLPLFDVVTLDPDPEMNFPISSTTKITTNYMGSCACLTQKSRKIVIYDLLANDLNVINTNELIVKALCSNKGEIFFVETPKECFINLKEQIGSAPSTPLMPPYKTEKYNNPNVLSACFSHNDRFLYVLYKNPMNDERILCTYSMPYAKLVMQRTLHDAWYIAPTQQDNEVWIACEESVKKLLYEEDQINMPILFEIPIESEVFDSIYVNSRDNYLIVEGPENIELVNINARRTDCLYKNIFLGAVAFSSDQKGIIGVEKNQNTQGSNNVIQMPFRYPEFNMELDNFFERSSLVQISTLKYLLKIFSEKPEGSIQPLVDLIKSIPVTLRDFVQAYCFPGIKLPRILEETSERPAKKQKHSYNKVNLSPIPLQA